MANLVWKYVSPLKEETVLDVLELKYCFLLPKDLKDCITKNNAGVPSLSTFDLEDKKGMVFGGLLSFNEGDLDNFNDFVDIFKTDDNNNLRMFPFALDPAGNFFCVQKSKIVLYNHEEDKVIPICNTFTELLAMLY